MTFHPVPYPIETPNGTLAGVWADGRVTFERDDSRPFGWRWESR